MPFKSQAQRRFMYGAEARGEVPKGTASEWEKATPSGKLPERVHKKAFDDGFSKVSGILSGAKKVIGNPHAMEVMGLGTLAAYPAYELARGKDKTRSALELGGLGALGLHSAKNLLSKRAAKSQIEMGREVEKEHRDTIKNIIKWVGKGETEKEIMPKAIDGIIGDHRKEGPGFHKFYYTALNAMEKVLKRIK